MYNNNNNNNDNDSLQCSTHFFRSILSNNMNSI
jgi:hypothetical protein